MNKKGFTLVELLAVIVILGLVMGIATNGVISAINTSKLKSEKVFVDKLSNLIDDYLDLKSQELMIDLAGEEYTFEKCRVSSCTPGDGNSYETTARKIKKTSGGNVSLNDLILAKVISKDDLVNPKNKEQCFESANPEIVVYRDSEYVYHYYVDLSGSNTNCDITTENALINNMPKNLTQELDDNGVTLPDILKDTL